MPSKSSQKETVQLSEGVSIEQLSAKVKGETNLVIICDEAYKLMRTSDEWVDKMLRWSFTRLHHKLIYVNTRAVNEPSERCEWVWASKNELQLLDGDVCVRV